MTFNEALKVLNIEDFGERIFNSNSRGELFHLQDYIALAEDLEGKDSTWFRPYFIGLVKWAEDTWERPESVFQHLLTLMRQAEEQTNEQR
jgi:hypothetical protein